MCIYNMYDIAGKVLGCPRQSPRHNLGLEAHENGTCKPCRFFHMKEEGCRIGAACHLPQASP